MRILVQKFGGTSLATHEQRERVAEKIIKACREGYAVVVVVSAMGRMGAPYATDTLIQLGNAANPELSKRELDLLLSCGEIISGAVLAGVLQRMGFDTVCLTGWQAGIITDSQYGNARIIEVKPQQVLRYLQEKKIVIVAGFQGITKEGEITTLGRGGSDTTAVALGVALQAEVVEIYTDVDGIKTADPRIVKEAKTLENITYNEICQLAHEGARVIHPRAVEIAMQNNIPLRVKCTFNNNPGTLVANRKGVLEDTTVIHHDRIITGITQISNITQLKIETKDYEDPQIQLKIFKAMALAGISVDFINVYPEAVIFTVRDEVADKAVEILKNMNLHPEVRRGCAKVAAVGAGMTGIPGVMAKIIEALTNEGIKILQSADSYTTIWCLVAREDMERAVRALHQQFLLSD
ncbi:aspartate kinase [Calderihabitans maritimus]|uniref:Aspartokinase n=1 Tax=Calderihabitans maritimus TaxID=1246530 RepID=A0A1Z5HQX7_9FIRM|nr:aspartate kinase [Calderihabitans maritimus]GAW91777.1 aspartate kinase [Calderihabitans maritimus]